NVLAARAQRHVDAGRRAAEDLQDRESGAGDRAARVTPSSKKVSDTFFQTAVRKMVSDTVLHSFLQKRCQTPFSGKKMVSDHCCPIRSNEKGLARSVRYNRSYHTTH